MSGLANSEDRCAVLDVRLPTGIDRGRRISAKLKNSTLPIYFDDTCEVDARLKVNPHFIIGVVVGIVLLAISIYKVLFTVILLLVSSHHSAYLVIWLAPLVYLLVLIHERIHFYLQWRYSRARPELGFKYYVFPYSKLSASVLRDQGLICTLSPLFSISVVLIVIAMFANPAVQAILIWMAYLHALSCSGDLVYAVWLGIHRRDLRLGVVNDESILFRKRQNA